VRNAPPFRFFEVGSMRIVVGPYFALRDVGHLRSLVAELLDHRIAQDLPLELLRLGAIGQTSALRLRGE
jgi:hypothetical protein